MSPSPTNPFGARSTLATAAGPVDLFRLDALSKAGVAGVDRLPFSLRVILEAALRHVDGFTVTEADVLGLARWEAKSPAAVEVPFRPARVVLQDFTGVPCIVDLAAMRDAMKRLGGDPAQHQPARPRRPRDRPQRPGGRVRVVRRAGEERRDRVPSATASATGSSSGARRRSGGSGPCRPRPASSTRSTSSTWPRSSRRRPKAGAPSAFPDSVVGTDSHTTMINGLGVVGWGVGGIEAEAVMLGQPIYMLTPRVVGARLSGELREGDHRHRPGADRHPDPAQEGRRRPVRRVLRAGARRDVAARPRHGREHGARVRRDHGLLPRRRRDARLPAPVGSHRRARRPRRALHEGAGALPHRRLARAGVHRHGRDRPVEGRAVPRGPQAPAGPRGARQGQGRASTA